MANFHGLHCAETILPRHRHPLSADGCIRFPSPDRRSFAAAGLHQDGREADLSGVSEETRLRLSFTDANALHPVTIPKLNSVKRSQKCFDVTRIDLLFEHRL